MATYFSIFLVCLTIASGLVWLVDSLVYAPKRKQKVVAVCANNNVEMTPQLVHEVAPLPLSSIMRNNYSHGLRQSLFCALLFTNHFRSHRVQ